MLSCERLPELCPEICITEQKSKDKNNGVERGENRMNALEEKILEHQLEEWKSLNSYVNQINAGCQQSIVIIVAVLTGIYGLVGRQGADGTGLNGVLLLLPPGLCVVLAYISYQFRVTAILQGHLAKLEDDMNAKLDAHPHMWNSALTNTYMAKNNEINKFVMIPALSFILLLAAMCFQPVKEIIEHQIGVAAVWIYWAAIVIFAVMIIVPFFRNEKIRAAAYDEESVLKLYRAGRAGTERKKGGKK